jgi:DNA-binding NarL/FixJ family response regulator
MDKIHSTESHSNKDNTQEVSEIHRECASELDSEILSVAQIRDLYPLICDANNRIDIIAIDLDTLAHVAENDLYSEMTALVTMLNTMPGPERDGSQGTRDTVIVGAAGLDTNSATIREFLTLDRRVAGIFPKGPEYTKEEKLEAMSQFLQGRHHIPKKVQQILRRKHKQSDAGTSQSLTPRQRQILSLITTRGSSNKVIARTLNISESTVKLHLGNIFKKFGVRNRTQLALFSQSDEK